MTNLDPRTQNPKDWSRDRSFFELYAHIRGHKIFGPKSREIAPKLVVPDDARPCSEANKSAKYPTSIGMPRRVGLHVRVQFKERPVS